MLQHFCTLIQIGRTNNLVKHQGTSQPLPSNPSAIAVCDRPAGIGKTKICKITWIRTNPWAGARTYVLTRCHNLSNKFAKIYRVKLVWHVIKVNEQMNNFRILSKDQRSNTSIHVKLMENTSWDKPLFEFEYQWGEIFLQINLAKVANQI